MGLDLFLAEAKRNWRSEWNSFGQYLVISPAWRSAWPWRRWPLVGLRVRGAIEDGLRQMAPRARAGGGGVGRSAVDRDRADRRPKTIYSGHQCRRRLVGGVLFGIGMAVMAAARAYWRWPAAAIRSLVVLIVFALVAYAMRGVLALRAPASAVYAIDAKALGG
jgi:hypothetical protein